MSEKNPMGTRKGSWQVVLCVIGLTLKFGLCVYGCVAVAGLQETTAQPLQASQEVERQQREAEALFAGGRVQEAVQVYERILQIDANFVPALTNLAWIRATSADPMLRRPVESVRLAERTFEQMLVNFNGRENRDAFPPSYDKLQILQVGATLIAAYAAVGRFQAPVEMDPTSPPLVKKGKVRQRSATARFMSDPCSGMDASTVAIWALAMAESVQKQSPSAETARLVEEIRALSRLVLAGRPIDDGRPLPGATRR